MPQFDSEAFLKDSASLTREEFLKKYLKPIGARTYTVTCEACQKAERILGPEWIDNEGHACYGQYDDVERACEGGGD